MKPRVLFCATIDGHFKSFHLPYLKWFKEQGYEVHVAANGTMLLPYVDCKFNISIQRSPFSAKNWRAYKELKKIIEDNDYQLIHCHTPMGGVLTRLAARKARKLGAKVIYTAHGFHFCKGAPLINWLLYYPIEKALARITDCLITINEEDYKLATQHHFKAGHIEHIHGIGVDTEQFIPVSIFQKDSLRKKFGYKTSDFILFYAAEFNKNKNQKLLIEAFSLFKDLMPNAKLLLAGDGSLLASCQTLAKERGLNNNIHFLGYQNEIKPFLQLSDLIVGSSLREGLPVNIMEAMACGLPILATKNRGHNELVENGSNGFIVMPGDKAIYASRLLQLSRNPELCRKMGEESRRRMVQFSLNQVSKELKEVYYKFMIDVGKTERKDWMYL